MARGDSRTYCLLVLGTNPINDVTLCEKILQVTGEGLRRPLERAVPSLSARCQIPETGSGVRVGSPKGGGVWARQSMHRD